jgi:hypothetical protein
VSSLVLGRLFILSSPFEDKTKTKQKISERKDERKIRKLLVRRSRSKSTPTDNFAHLHMEDNFIYLRLCFYQ